MFKNNQIDKINQYTSLTKLGLGGGISIKSVTEQKKLEELFLFEKLKDIESIGSMTNLKKITFSKMTIKNLVSYIKEHKNAEKIACIASNDEPIIAASFQQKKIWMAEQKEIADKGTADYHMVACYSVKNLDYSGSEEPVSN